MILKMTSFENKKIYRNQFSIKSDGFPPKDKKKPCRSLCKGEHLTYLCGLLSSLRELQKKSHLLKSKLFTNLYLKFYKSRSIILKITMSYSVFFD